MKKINFKKSPKIKIVLLVFVGLFLIAYIFKNGSQEPFYFKQWYINDNSDITAISDCLDYRSYISYNPEVHIGYPAKPPLSRREVVVAIIDTGIDFTHEDLSGIEWINTDEIPGDGEDNDNNGYIDDIFGFDFCNMQGIQTISNNLKNSHATKIAGVIAARRNGVGILGIGGDIDLKIMSLKILNSEGGQDAGQIENLVQAIKYAEANGATICNISMSTKKYSKTLEDTIKDSPMLFVVSAGNGVIRGQNIDVHPIYPACFSFDNLITVGNLDYNGELFLSSNYGIDSVSISAPGTCIYTTDVNNQYTYSIGTSIAAPMVTGTAAVLFSIADHNLSAIELKKIICTTVVYSSTLADKTTYGGYINLNAAIQKVLSQDVFK